MAHHALLGELLPQPIVQELDGEAAWNEWVQAVERSEQGFAATQPMPLDELPGPPFAGS